MDNSSGSLNYGGLYNSAGWLYSGYGPVHRKEGSFQNMQAPVDWNADRGMNSNGSLRNMNGFRGNYSACAHKRIDRWHHSCSQDTMTSQSFHSNTNSFQVFRHCPTLRVLRILSHVVFHIRDLPAWIHVIPRSNILFRVRCRMMFGIQHSGIGGIGEATSDGDLPKHTSTAGNSVLKLYFIYSHFDLRNWATIEKHNQLQSHSRVKNATFIQHL